MGSENHQDNLKAAFVDRTVVIRIDGRGSFKVSPPLKQFVLRVIESGTANHILIDMSQCCSMDSTFMGVLAGLSYQIKEKADYSLKLTNLSPKNEKLLTTLGVDRVVSYSTVPTEEEQAQMARISLDAQTVGDGKTDTLEAAKTSLEAHETLVELNPDNLVKFKSVLELLQKDVDKLNR